MISHNQNQNEIKDSTVSSRRSLIVGALVSAGITIYLYGIENYSEGDAFFDFSILQKINILIFTVLGALASYYYDRKQQFRALLLFTAIALLFSLNIVMHGVQGIKKEEIVVRFVKFTGKDAIYYGYFDIFLAVLIASLALLMPIVYWIKRRKKNNG